MKRNLRKKTLLKIGIIVCFLLCLSSFRIMNFCLDESNYHIDDTLVNTYSSNTHTNKIQIFHFLSLEQVIITHK